MNLKKITVFVIAMMVVVGCGGGSGGGSGDSASSASSSNFSIESEKNTVPYSEVASLIESSPSYSGDNLKAKLKSVPFWYRIVVENGKHNYYFIEFKQVPELGEEYSWFGEKYEDPNTIPHMKRGSFVDGGSIDYGENTITLDDVRTYSIAILDDRIILYNSTQALVLWASKRDAYTNQAVYPEAFQSSSSMYWGSSQFSNDMLGGATVYFSRDEDGDGIYAPNEWIWMNFHFGANTILYEKDGQRYTDATYSVENGILIIRNLQGETYQFKLNNATQTEWQVTRTDSNGITDDTTIYLALDYYKNLLVGNTFRASFVNETIEIKFTEDQMIGTVNGQAVQQSYIIENGQLVRDPSGMPARRTLIKVESNGSFWSWNSNDPEANFFEKVQ